jgi:hypothetical protein
MGLDTAIDPKRKYKWHEQRRRENGDQEGRLSKEMKNREDDGEYCQFRAYAANHHSSPMQAAQDLPVNGEFFE